MDYKRYLNMEIDRLEKELIMDVVNNPKEASALIRDLKASGRYREDPLFCICVDITELVLSFSIGDYMSILSKGHDLAERAEALSRPRLVSWAWNQLGSAYFVYELFEQALECYHRVIAHERKHDINLCRALAHNNIALIFINLKGGDRIRVHLELAIESMKAREGDPAKIAANVFACKSTLAEYCLSSGNMEAVKEFVKEFENLDLSLFLADHLYNIYRVLCRYNIHIGDSARAREFFLKSVDCVSSLHPIYRLRAVAGFVEECQKFRLDPSVYEDLFAELENSPGEGGDSEHRLAAQILEKHYESLGNDEKATFFRERSVSLLEAEFENGKRDRRISLQVVHEVLEKKKDMENDVIQNSRLHLVAQEAVRQKEQSQQAYRQLDLVHRLGQKLTASMDSEAVAELIYRNLKEHLPVDSFVLMVSDKEKKELRSIAYIEGEEVRPEISFRWQDPNSLFAECYRSKRAILIEDFSSDPRFFYRKTVKIGERKVMSGLFLPLLIEDEVIGAVSVQSNRIAAYRKEDRELLDVLTPYLAVALNNAMYSTRLEREIQDRIRAQRELEEANRKLRELSSLDGLTQIAIRREFERRLLEMLGEATEKDDSVAIFMFDIDNFKKYNDTYGHLRGDEVLKRVAEVLREKLERVGGVSARFGGEEFIGACAGRSAAEYSALAESIREGVRALGIEHFGAPSGVLTVSIGVSIGEGTALADKSALMRNADDALYEAKNSGKDRAVCRF